MSKDLTTKGQSDLAIRSEGFLSQGYSLQKAIEGLTEVFPNGEISPFSLEKLRMPGLNPEAWELETSSGVEKLPSITGVLVCRIPGVPIRSLYKEKYDPANPKQPDCSSLDGLTGIGDPGGSCLTCPEKKFDTGKCAPTSVWYFIHSNRRLPSNLQIPLTSQKYFMKFAQAVVSEGFKISEIAIEIGFNSKKGDKCNSMYFRKVADLTPEESARVAKFREFLGSLQVVVEPDQAGELNASDEVPF